MLVHGMIIEERIYHPEVTLDYLLISASGVFAGIWKHMLVIIAELRHAG